MAQTNFSLYFDMDCIIMRKDKRHSWTKNWYTCQRVLTLILYLAFWSGCRPFFLSRLKKILQILLSAEGVGWCIHPWCILPTIENVEFIYFHPILKSVIWNAWIKWKNTLSIRMKIGQKPSLWIHRLIMVTSCWLYLSIRMEICTFYEVQDRYRCYHIES